MLSNQKKTCRPTSNVPQHLTLGRQYSFQTNPNPFFTYLAKSQFSMVTSSYIPFFQSSKYAETIRNPSPSDPNGVQDTLRPRPKRRTPLRPHRSVPPVGYPSPKGKKWRIYSTEIMWIYVDLTLFYNALLCAKVYTNTVLSNIRRIILDIESVITVFASSKVTSFLIWLCIKRASKVVYPNRNTVWIPKHDQLCGLPK